MTIIIERPVVHDETYLLDHLSICIIIQGIKERERDGVKMEKRSKDLTKRKWSGEYTADLHLYRYFSCLFYD
jgi:hypothetical protein